MKIKLRTRRFVAVIAAAACVVAVVVGTKHFLSNSAPSLLRVVAYEVFDNNTVLMLLTSRSGAVSGKTSLARVDASGRTVWIREVPGRAESGEALRIGNGVIAVRYVHSETARPHEQSHTMAAFDAEGRRLWDATLGADQEELHKVAGSVIGDVFVEWGDARSKVLMTGVAQRTGQRLFTTALAAMPYLVYRTRSRLLWIDDDSEQVRLHLGDTSKRLAPTVLHSVDPMTGDVQTASASGRGCVLDDEYVTVLGDDSKSLVAFQAGNLKSPRVLSTNFDPLGNDQWFALHSCGRFNHSLVFALETVQGREAQLVVVITDEHGMPVRSIRLPDETMHRHRVFSPSQQPSLSGELTRFVPVLVPRNGWSSAHDEIVMLDLENGTIAWHAQLTSVLFAKLFRYEQTWYLSDVDNGKLSFAVFDGTTGRVRGAGIVEGVASGTRFEQALLPLHVGRSNVWLAPYDETTATALPILVLDTTSFRPLHGSRRVRVTDRKTEFSSRIVPPQL